MVSNTGWMSVGERLMTRRISLVAVCCSSASVRSRVARLQLLEQPHVLDGDDGLVGEGLEQLDLPIGECADLGRGRQDDHADATPSRMSMGRRARVRIAGAALGSRCRNSASAMHVHDVDRPRFEDGAPADRAAARRQEQVAPMLADAPASAP